MAEHAPDPVSTAFLLVELRKKTGTPVWVVKWRTASGERVRRRLGADAWVEPAEGGGWRPRSGRAPAGTALTEFQARRRMPEFVRAAEAEFAEATARRLQAAEAASARTFRQLAHAWLDHLVDVRAAKPSTLRDYRSMLAEPGVPHRRGSGTTVGRIMSALGDLPASTVTTRDVEKLLAAHAREGVGPRSVNKHRQVIATIFNYGLQPAQADDWRLTTNPAAAAPRRREDDPVRLEVFTVEQIEQLARVAASGMWRAEGTAGEDGEDEQLAELLRVAAYTGLRRGELVVLRWRDVRWSERVLVVERALSGDVEGSTKSRKPRYVPLGDQALGALDRLSLRPNFTGADDYVFAGIAGDRLDPSALRRRYVAARDAAGLPPLRFHDLRHTAGTLLTRVLDPVTVRDILGHADLKTTERYLHAVRASRLADVATQAFADEAQGLDGEDDALRAALRTALERLNPSEVENLLREVAGSESRPVR